MLAALWVAAVITFFAILKKFRTTKATIPYRSV
jgi:hypothetical protein